MSRSDSPKRRKHHKLAKGPRIPPCPTSSKRSYRSEKRALTALNDNISKGGGAIAVYKCRFCTQWHLTSKEQRAA